MQGLSNFKELLSWLLIDPSHLPWGHFEKSSELLELERFILALFIIAINPTELIKIIIQLRS